MSRAAAAGSFEVHHGVVAGRSGPISIRDYNPTRPISGTPFLWVHGGAFMSGGLRQAESDAPVRWWAAAGRWVRTVDHRLAPRTSLFRDRVPEPSPNRFPAGLDDVVDVARALAEESEGPILLGGASAGANLAAATTLRLRDEGGPLPLRLALAYGTFHAVLPVESPVYAQLRGPLARWFFNPAMTRRMNLNYVGDPTLLVPGYAFPGGADLADLPPTLVLDASNDRLHASGRAFAAELRSAGVVVKDITVKAHHGFLGQPWTRGFVHGTRELRDWLDTVY